MAPEGDDEGYYNLWQGFQVASVEGSWKLMKKHILHVICSGDKAIYRYVINWLARMIQEPWTPGEVAIVLRGGEGIGKGALVNNLCRIFGQHSCSLRNINHITGNFNAHMSDCILMYVDEAFWAGSKGAEGVLRGIITEPTLFIVPKFVDGKERRNMLHIIMSSNNDWVVPASFDARRYCVLDVSDHRKGDREYFNALFTEINNGGLEAMLYDLEHTDISCFEVRDFPITNALIKQKILSLEPVKTWWYQKLNDGELIQGFGWKQVSSQDLYDDYVVSAKKQGISWPGSQTIFGIELRKVLPKDWILKGRQASKDSFGKRPNLYKFPSLKVCRRSFEMYLGVVGVNNVFDWSNSDS